MTPNYSLELPVYFQSWDPKIWMSFIQQAYCFKMFLHWFFHIVWCFFCLLLRKKMLLCQKHTSIVRDKIIINDDQIPPKHPERPFIVNPCGWVLASRPITAAGPAGSGETMDQTRKRAIVVQLNSCGRERDKALIGSRAQEKQV